MGLGHEMFWIGGGGYRGNRLNCDLCDYRITMIRNQKALGIGVFLLGCFPPPTVRGRDLSRSVENWKTSPAGK